MVNQLMTKRRMQQGVVQYALVTAVIVAVGGYFGLMNYGEYQAASAAFAQGTSTLTTLKISADKANLDYGSLKKQMDQANSSVNGAVEKIYPSTENFTTLARDLDYYFLNTATSTNPMFLSDLRFGQVRMEDGKDFAILPFTMNVNGNEDGLKAFMDYVGKTGDLNDKSRLLKLISINMSYQNNRSDSGSSADNIGTVAVSASPLVSASLNMEAYFQKPLEADLNKTPKS